VEWAGFWIAFENMSCSTLSLELSRHQLTPAVYLHLYCDDHGMMRIAVPKPPTKLFHPCPLCRAHCGYKLLDEGGTQRQLPFFELIPQQSFCFGFPQAG
jgi:hypothetical protein